MNSKNQKSPFLVPLLVCLVITVLMGGVLVWLYRDEGVLPPDTTDTEDTTKQDPPEVANVIFKTDLSAYETYMDPEQRDEYLLLVNKENPLPESYKPSELVPVKDARKDISLAETAEMALEAMFIEIRAEGFSGIFVTSAYRSYNQQETTFNDWISFEKDRISTDAYKCLGHDYIYEKYTAKGKTKLDSADAERVASSYSARPGTSEHQTGLCVDLMSNSMRELDESFADEPVYEWLLENAWKFGFILRFPADKTDITGYTFEPWHYRFVGRYHAYMMHKDELCLEEYVS